SRIYKITLRLFRDQQCTDCADMPPSVIIGIFNNDNNQRYGGLHTVSVGTSEALPINPLPPCLINEPLLIYRVAYYTFTVELDNNSSGYTATYQTCCRVDGIRNVPNSVGATYTCQIPPTADSSPRFSKGISVVCYRNRFTLDFT